MARPDLSIRLRALALATICAVSLGAAGCGGDDETTATSTTTTGATGVEGATDAAAAAASTQLRDQLEGTGIPQEGVDCIVDELQGELTEATDAASVDLEAVQEATTKCAQETGGAAAP